MITSFQNPQIKYLKALLLKKNRDKEERFLLEGKNLVEEAFKARGLDCFYYSEESPLVQKLLKNGIQGILVAEKVLRNIGTTEEPQPILGVAQKPAWSWSEILKRESLLIMVADRIQDPGNLGVLIRTASGVGADAVVLSVGCVDPYNSKVLRSSAGAIFHLAVIEEGPVLPLVKKLKAEGIKVYAAEQKAARNYREIRYNKRTALVFGNEGQGLEDKVLDQCDEKIAVPMWGHLESLNVAVSAGIILYEVGMQKKGLS